ncbi:hypothetical protein YC2023_124260 [Brassica napus]
MDLRQWDMELQWVTRLRIWTVYHDSKGLHGVWERLEDPERKDLSDLRGNFRQGKLGIKGYWVVTEDRSGICFRFLGKDFHGIFSEVFNSKWDWVDLGIMEDSKRSYFSRDRKVSIEFLMHIKVSQDLGSSDLICRINQTRLDLPLWRGDVELLGYYKNREGVKEWQIGHRNNQRGDDGGYRYRGDRGDRTRRYGTVNNFNAARGVRRGASPRTGAAEDAREEGEIPHQDHRAQRLDDELSLSIPLQGNAAQVDDPKVNSVLESEENGLDVVNEFLETENNKGEEDSMELGDEQVNLEGDDGEDVENASGEENFQNLTDGEVEESNDQIDDTLGDIKEDDITVGGMEEKEAAAGEEDKKKGARRGLIKPSLVAGGSTKARMVQAYISNRKRTSTKPVNRNGEGSKQQEEQGTSKPKPHSTKP